MSRNVLSAHFPSISAPAVVAVKNPEARSAFCGLIPLQQFAHQIEADCTLLFQRISVERIENFNQRFEIARPAFEHEIDDLGPQRIAARRRVRVQRRVQPGFAQSLHLKHQSPTEAAT